MRIAIVRTDIGNIYVSDIENTSQRNFSSQPRGQSLYLKRPDDPAFLAILNDFGKVTVRGTDTGATVDTAGTSNGTKLRIRSDSSASFTVATVTSGSAVTKGLIVAELNASLTSIGLFVSVDGTNRVIIETLVGGPSAYLEVDATSAALHLLLGIAAADIPGLSVAELKSAVYPTSTTVDVSESNILSLSTFSLLPESVQDDFVSSVAGVVAPRLVETGPVLLSFAYGILSKLRDSSFRPGGSRIGLPAGVAAAMVQDDGSTPFTI